MGGWRATRSLACVASGLLAFTIALPAAASPAPTGPGSTGQPRTTAFRPAALGTASPGWRVDVRLPPDLAESPQEFSPGYSFFDVEAVGSRDGWAVGTSGRNILSW